MWSSQNLEAPLSTAQAVSTPARQPEFCSFFRPCQPGEVNNLEEDAFTDRRWSANTRHVPLGGEDRKNTAVRSLTFPLSAMEDVTEEEETVLIQPVSYFNEDNFVEERDVVLWYPQQEKIWLHEDGGAGGSGEYSQRSVTGCQTKTTKAMMLDISDPGAPTKEDRRKKYISSDTDENSTPCIGPTSHRHSYLSIENNSVSFPCDSSAPSRITPLEEAGESIDLANHLSHLAVAGSPTQKRLLFTGDVDCPTDPPHLPTPLLPLSPTRRENYKGLSPGMQLLCRGKRFLDEMDTNRDANSSNSTTRTTRETHRKFRRIDVREGGNRVSSPRREKYRR